MAEARASLVAGQQITKGVRLLRPLSSGGMGAVWLADHLSLKTRVVVKFMLGGLDSSESARTRFSREAAAAAQVKSPHVVQMLDHGVSDEGVPFIVMEHLEGHDLGDEIEKSGPVEPAKVVAIVSQVAKALSKVHAAGLLHRDIKPDNIFLVDGEEDVFVKLLDFGIAKSSTVDQGDGSLDGETKTGQIVGTPFYMSPEQVTAQKTIDHRSDLWALGVVAYEALTGKRPYDGPSFGALAVKIATGDPPRMTELNPSLPPAVDAWFAKACAREASARFSSAREMADAFRAAFDGVVSLPSSGLNSDSGQRGGTPSGSGVRASSPDERESGSRSGPRDVSPTLGLAATALDDSANRHVALGRSEGGVSVAEDTRSSGRSSTMLYVGAAVALSVVAGAVLITTVRGDGADAKAAASSATHATATSTATASPASSPKLAIAATAPASAVSAAVSSSNKALDASVAAATDAAATAASASAVMPVTAATARATAVRPASSSHAPANGATTPKASAESSASPAPTPKPTDTAPDLY